MDHLAKIHLSKQEKDLVKNTDWIFSKRLILKKAEILLSQLQQDFQSVLLSQENENIHQLAALRSKIAKGENYKGLPWLILDYPAQFHKSGIFAIRTMFWWGNYFTCTLHVSGKYMPAQYELKKWLNFFSKANYYVSTGNDEWEHEVNAANYRRASELTEIQKKNMGEKCFFKAAYLVSLEDFPKAQAALLESMTVFLEFMLATPNTMNQIGNLRLP